LASVEMGVRTSRRIYVAAFVAACAATVAVPALAQRPEGYPVRPIRLIVPFTPGAGADTVARRLALRMSENWNQQVVVDNRAGAGGTIGINIVAKASPDGYTLLVHSLAFAVSAALYAKLPYDSIKDFAPITQISQAPSVMIVAPALGVKSVKDLIALARSKPGQINFASAGIGSGTHLNGEQFRYAAGISVTHVPYKGPNEALVDVATGRIQYFISPLVPALPFIRDGRLIPLAVTTAQRARALPDVPTVAESALPGYEYQAWFGTFAPAATPRPIVDWIGREIARVMALPDVIKQFQAQGEDVRTSTPEEFARFVRAEIEKYRKIARLANIRVE
jgi:tripartite-type tricarboxylate transporter receptor subunit TctC